MTGEFALKNLNHAWKLCCSKILCKLQNIIHSWFLNYFFRTYNYFLFGCFTNCCPGVKLFNWYAINWNSTFGTPLMTQIKKLKTFGPPGPVLLIKTSITCPFSSSSSKNNCLRKNKRRKCSLRFAFQTFGMNDKHNFV